MPVQRSKMSLIKKWLPRLAYKKEIEMYKQQISNLIAEYKEKGFERCINPLFYNDADKFVADEINAWLHRIGYKVYYDHNVLMISWDSNVVEMTLYQFMEFVDVALYNNDCSDLDDVLKSQVKQFYPTMNVKDVLYALVINQMKKTLE